jgi:hypothetical protein
MCVRAQLGAKPQFTITDCKHATWLGSKRSLFCNEQMMRVHAQLNTKS